MREVTDPGILDKLNGIVAQGTGLKEVTDPGVLAQLNSQSQSTTTPTAGADSQGGMLSAITQPISDFINEQRQRGAHLNDIVNAVQQGNKTLPEGIAEGVMNSAAGPVGDIAGAGASMAGKAAYNILPQSAQNAIDSVKQQIVPIAQAYQQNLDTYNKQNPRAGDALQAVRELGNVLPLGSSAVRGAVDAGADVAGQALKNVTKDAITGTLDALKKDPIPTFEATKALSQVDYAKAKALDATYSPEIRQQYIDAIKTALPGEEKVLPGNTTIENIYKQAITNKDKPLTLEGIQQIDQELTDLRHDAVHPNGLPTAEGKRIGDIQKALRDAVGNAKESQVTGGKEGWDTLQKANANWSASRKIYEIEKIFSRAEMTDNPATAIKAGMRNLYLNEKKTSGWTGREKSLLKAAGKSSAAANLLRTQVGSRLISSMIGTAAGSIGGIPGMMAGATIGAATGGTARAVANAMQKGRANKVLKQIGKGIKK